MGAVRTIAALLAVLAVAAVAAADPSDKGERTKFRRWLHECSKEAGVRKSKPLWAVKKSIAGLYDPQSHRAFRRTKLTIVKYEFATVRDPSQAEKCLMECLAEKQGMINGSKLDGTMIMNVMMGIGKRINLMSRHKRVNITMLKRYTGQCITTTHGSTQTCELGYRLFRCLRRAVMDSLYENFTTEVPTTSTTTSWTTGAPTPSYEPTGPYPPPPPPPQRLMGPPQPIPMGMPMAPPPMPAGGIATPDGMTPSLVAYRQGSGLVQVYRRDSAPWRQHWGHHRPRMQPMI